MLSDIFSSFYLPSSEITLWQIPFSIHWGAACVLTAEFGEMFWKLLGGYTMVNICWLCAIFSHNFPHPQLYEQCLHCKGCQYQLRSMVSISQINYMFFFFYESWFLALCLRTFCLPNSLRNLINVNTFPTTF